MAVVIETTLGDFTVDLYTEERPQTCKNFLKLCKIKYYNFCLFHSVQTNFLAQTGDPTGSGTGGESIFGIVYGDKARYYEAEKLPKLKHTKPGLLSMVNCGDNMLGSQFFLTLGSELQSLDEHCIFAEITEGMEILLKLNETICDNQHRPYKDIRITHTVILEDPFEDPSGLIVPSTSPEPSLLTLQNGRIGADEEIDETAGMTVAEVEEMKQAREAQARATILEIVGDLPDAEMAPPENVLFVCKLNPVTTDDDLEIIFSRFGKVKSCEVIRDHETGDSLQYAFIEFEEQKACEEAYFKMDNVLIDDRRIHVDFSQSVAKMRWKGKGRGVEYLDKNDKDREKNQYSGESRSNSRREHVRNNRENFRESREENHRDVRDWSHRKRQDEERPRRREISNDHQRTDKRKYEDCRKSDDRRRLDGFKGREGNNQRFENRNNHDRRDYNYSSRREDSRRREIDRKEKTFRKNDLYHKEERGKEKFDRSSSRNRSHSIDHYRDKKQGSPFISKSKENGIQEQKGGSSNKEAIVNISKDKTEKDDLLNSSYDRSANSDILDSKTSEEPVSVKRELEDQDHQEVKTESFKQFDPECSSKEPTKLRESSLSSEKKLKRKQKSEEYKHRKKRKTSSSSSSAASDSSNSSSSSESTSSDYKHKRKRHKTVAKKYYHHGKLVKVVKEKRDTSESETFTDSSSESDRRRRRKKGRKKHTKKIVKIIEKRRFDSSDDSGSESSTSDDSENERSKKKKRRKVSEKKKRKKKRNNPIKKHKRAKSEESSESEEKTPSHKTKKNKKENNTTQTSD